MTPEQYDRWKDFALRMARTCYYGNRRPTSRWIADVVEDFFDHGIWGNAVPCIVDWDNSTEYPEGNPYREREYNSSYCCCEGRLTGPDRAPNPECPECRGRGTHHAWEKPYPVCDMMTEFFDNYRGYAPRCHLCKTYNRDKDCRCDEIEEHYYEQWDTQWGDQVRCCIRAGLDFASAPSAGVLGFTAGDLRRMYPEGVPDWVFPPDERLHYWCSDELNGTFAELADSAGVVL